MSQIAIDLGTTNVKVALYDDALGRKAMVSRPVMYFRSGKQVEFDANAYFDSIVEMLKELGASDVKCVTLTGQAESLVLLGDDMQPLMNAISWMDERSSDACGELSEKFESGLYYKITGQCAIIPTWPATKILHLGRHAPQLIEKVKYFLLLKDYIVYRLTGKLLADKSIATFSSYFDIHNGTYWEDMLVACAIRPDQLAPLVEPCTIAGSLSSDIRIATGIGDAKVNIGTLDHFAGMIGVGNIAPGAISESTGTVLAMATLAVLPLSGDETAALHYGPFPGSYVFLPTCESGGISLEWFKERFLPNTDYDEINERLSSRQLPGDLLFLPYIAGANAPEYDQNASGVFYGLRTEHDVFDMAGAIMEGVAHLISRNIRDVCPTGNKPKRIISMGGGAKSDIWSKLKADITGLTVEIPEDSEAACLGAAMIGAVSSGSFRNLEEAVAGTVRIKKAFDPETSPIVHAKRRGFDALYDGMIRTAAAIKHG